jgi:hypothetical protein
LVRLLVPVVGRPSRSTEQLGRRNGVQSGCKLSETQSNSGHCASPQSDEREPTTGFAGLWSRRSGVRVPSLTPKALQNLIFPK